MRFWLQTIALLLAMFAGFEVLCRLLIGHSPIMRFDPSYDRIPLPHQPVVQSREGFSRGTTNELGHLDAPMPSPLPADGILVIGDSFTQARQVASEDRFTERLGGLLQRRVYNAGHTGWSPIHALAFLTTERATFAPQTVIVQIAGNDLEDMVARKRPHVTVNPAGELALVWPDRNKQGSEKRITDVREAITSRSALAGELLFAVLTLAKGKGLEDEGRGDDPHLACERPNPLLWRAMPWLFGDLRRAHPDVRLVYIPLLDYHAGCVDRCWVGRELFRVAAEAHGIPLVDVTAAMCARFAATRQPLSGFWNTIPGSRHLNAEGHAVVAEELAAELRKTR